MNIQHEEDAVQGSFYIEDEDGERVAEMTYARDSETHWTIDHTGVVEQLQHQGVAKRLVLAAVERARQEGVRITPLCPYAKAVFDRSPELNDVLDAT